MAVVLNGTLVDGVLLRMRDPGGNAHPRTLVRSLLTDWQRLLNGKYAWSLETLTLATPVRFSGGTLTVTNGDVLDAGGAAPGRDRG